MSDSGQAQRARRPEGRVTPRRLGALLVALVLAGSAHVNAYVRSRTTKGTVTAWRSGCVLVQADSTGSPDLAAAVSTAAIKRSLTAWRDATLGCSYMVLQYVEPAALDAHFDGLNVIKFRSDRWCHPDDAKTTNVCYDAVAAGITTVWYVDRPGSADDGTMLDTDIELNNLNFTFDVVDPLAAISRQPRAGTTIADLENTLVHELGHLQGLDHTCKDSATPAQELDQNGNPPMACKDLRGLTQSERSVILEATMYNSASPAEMKKRSPEADDVAGICNAYPLAADPKACAPQPIAIYGGGCALGAPAPPRAGLLLMLAALGGLLLRRRRLAP